MTHVDVRRRDERRKWHGLIGWAASGVLNCGILDVEVAERGGRE